MKKSPLPQLLLLFIALFFYNSLVFASSNLEISSSGDFSTTTDEFSAAQNIYVRVENDSEGSKKHELNLRDSDYKLISSYNLSKNGNFFSASLQAPQSSGYYSLETIIESNGSSSTSVKTIKVDNPSKSNININVTSKVKGESTISRISPSPSPKPSQAPKKENISSSSPEPTQEATVEEPETKSNVYTRLGSFLVKLFSVLWPF